MVAYVTRESGGNTPRTALLGFRESSGRAHFPERHETSPRKVGDPREAAPHTPPWHRHFPWEQEILFLHGEPLRGFLQREIQSPGHRSSGLRVPRGRILRSHSEGERY